MTAAQAPRKKNKTKPLLEPLNEELEHNYGNSKFARALGSVDFQTREKGIAALQRLLQKKTDITQADMLKLWKGLYFCFWHSDKAPVQMELAGRLAAVMLHLSEEVAYLYFSCFLTTMRREWFLLDRLRLDKFLLLARKFVNAMLTYLAQHSWRPDLRARYAQVLSGVLMPTDTLNATGFAYHLCDVFVPELQAVAAAAAATAPAPAGRTAGGSSTSGQVRPVAGALLPLPLLLSLLGPFVDVLQQAGDKPLLARVRQSVFEELLENMEQAEAAAQEDGDDAAGGQAGAAAATLLSQGLLPELAAALFEAGAVPSVKQRNRTELYGIAQLLEKQAHKRARKEAKAGKSPQPATTPSATVVQPQAASRAGAAGRLQGAQVAGQEQGLPAASPLPAGKPGQQRQAQAADTLGAAGSGAVADGGTAAAGASPQVPAVPAQAAAPSPQPGKKRKAAQAGAQAASAAATPVAASLQQPTPRGGAAGAAAQHRQAPEPACAAANGPGPGPVSRGSGKGKGKAKAMAMATPGGSGKKRVRINLTSNLYFDFGGPVPDPMLRTPPASRSKGGILKQQHRAAAQASGAALKQPQSAPPKMRAQAKASLPLTAAQQLLQQQVAQAGAGSPRMPQSESKAGKHKQGGGAPAGAKRARAADMFAISSPA